jgi:hypothetical protein
LLRHSGVGSVEEDYVEAYNWYAVAAYHGGPDASDSQELVSKNMTPDQIAEAERLVAKWEPYPAVCDSLRCPLLARNGPDSP